jgi:hypothetical protein
MDFSKKSYKAHFDLKTEDKGATETVVLFYKRRQPLGYNEAIGRSCRAKCGMELIDLVKASRCL